MKKEPDSQAVRAQRYRANRKANRADADRKIKDEHNKHERRRYWAQKRGGGGRMVSRVSTLNNLFYSFHSLTAVSGLSFELF